MGLRRLRRLFKALSCAAIAAACSVALAQTGEADVEIGAPAGAPAAASGPLIPVRPGSAAAGAWSGGSGPLIPVRPGAGWSSGGGSGAWIPVQPSYYGYGGYAGSQAWIPVQPQTGGFTGLPRYQGYGYPWQTPTQGPQAGGAPGGDLWSLPPPGSAERYFRPGEYNPNDPNLGRGSGKVTDLQMRTRCTDCDRDLPGGDTKIERSVPDTNSPRRLPGPQDDLQQREIGRLAWGARRTMGTIFQNCDALRADNLIPGDWRQPGLIPAPAGEASVPGQALIDTDRIQAGRELERHTPHDFFRPEVVAAQSWYIHQGQSAPQCRDVRGAPPVFYIGRKPSFTRPRDGNGPVVINVRRETPRPAGAERGFTALDCTGFVSASLAAAGVRVRVGSNNTEISSTSLSDMGRNPNDCFRPMQFAANASIQSGDIFAFRTPGEVYGHSLVVETVGPDPFGIRGIRDAAACRAANMTEEACANQCTPAALPWERYDFTVIQASSILDRIAVSRMHVNQFLWGMNSEMKGLFAASAMAACRAKATGRPVSGRIATERRAASIMRHDSARAACFDPAGPGSFGDIGACMDSCQDARRGQPSGTGAQQ